MCNFEEKNVQNFYIFSNLFFFFLNSEDSPLKHLAELGVNSKFKINIGDYIYLGLEQDLCLTFMRLTANV